MSNARLSQSIAIAVASLLWLGASVASSAQLTATPGSALVGVGDSIDVEVHLALSGDEVASVFEAVLSLEGLTEISLEPGGPSWAGASGAVDTNLVSLSLTSSNLGGDRLVAILSLTPLEIGAVELRLEGTPLVERDTAMSPFFETVPVSTSPGRLLARLVVVPETSTALLLGLAAFALALKALAIRAGCSAGGTVHAHRAR